MARATLVPRVASPQLRVLLHLFKQDGVYTHLRHHPRPAVSLLRRQQRFQAGKRVDGCRRLAHLEQIRRGEGLGRIPTNYSDL